MKQKVLFLLLTIIGINASVFLYQRLRATTMSVPHAAPQAGYKVACLRQGKSGDKLIATHAPYNLALSDKASNRCFYRFNKAFFGDRDGRKDPIIQPEVYDVITISMKNSLYSSLKNNPDYVHKALYTPYTTFIRKDSSYAHLFQPTAKSTRHILEQAPAAPVDTWNELCEMLGGDNCHP